MRSIFKVPLDCYFFCIFLSKRAALAVRMAVRSSCTARVSACRCGMRIRWTARRATPALRIAILSASTSIISAISDRMPSITSVISKWAPYAVRMTLWSSLTARVCAVGCGMRVRRTTRGTTFALRITILPSFASYIPTLGSRVTASTSKISKRTSSAVRMAVFFSLRHSESHDRQTLNGNLENSEKGNPCIGGGNIATLCIGRLRIHSPCVGHRNHNWSLRSSRSFF